MSLFPYSPEARHIVPNRKGDMIPCPPFVRRYRRFSLNEGHGIVSPIYPNNASISSTARSMPTTAARATIAKPMLSSAISGRATMGPTFR